MEKNLRRIGGIVGSDSDLKQCVEGLDFLIDQKFQGNVSLAWFDTASQHRNTLPVQGILTAYSLLPADQKVDILIIGAGMAAHLPACSDAFMRNTLRDDRIVVIAVAFEDKTNQENTLAAVYSITYVLGTQAVFKKYVGKEGFLQACRDALTMELPKIKLPPVKPWVRRTFLEARIEGKRLLEEE